MVGEYDPQHPTAVNIPAGDPRLRPAQRPLYWTLNVRGHNYYEKHLASTPLYGECSAPAPVYFDPECTK